MKMKHSTALLLMIATLLAGLATTAWGQSADPITITLPPSSVLNPANAGLRASTNLEILGTGPVVGKPEYYGPPFGGLFYETPSSLACVYQFEAGPAGCNPYATSFNPSGGAGAIAVVDAYNDFNAYTDLSNYSAQFGVGAINPTSFIVVYAPYGGGTPGSCLGSVPGPVPPPAELTGWDVEESLDIEMAHAMAPAATLYLVEAQSDYFSDLFCAVTVASNLVQAAGGGEVSMSWGGGEFSGETAYDPVFTTPSVVYFASAGDGPGVIYPSASPNVVAVGGTTISRNLATGKYISENTWQQGGGGISAVEARPSYQSGISSKVGAWRGTPDVSADANPITGVWVLDTLTYGPGTWYIVGGTSVSSPLWAGVVNAAEAATPPFAASSKAELTKLYADTTGFGDITVGNCGPYMGYFAGTGWDFCTGIGSPRKYTGK